MSITRRRPSGVGGGATARLRTSPAIVVDLGQVEVHPAGAVPVDLGAGHERAGELLEHERVEHVARRVQRGDAQPVIGVDPHPDRAVGGRRRIVEQMPPELAVDLDAGDTRRPGSPFDRADVADLPAPARVERRAGQGDRAGPHGDHLGVVVDEVRFGVTQVDGHRRHCTAGPGVGPVGAGVSTGPGDRCSGAVAEPAARDAGDDEVTAGDRHETEPA